MFHWFSTETLLACGYALFLVLTAAVLEFVARQSHRRSGQFELAGFHYDRKLDHWECPVGEKLCRAEIDHALRIVRYQASPQACNACALKPSCTGSDHGREIKQHLGGWLDTEVGRFHRGTSHTLLFLAALILGIETFRVQSGDRLVVGTALAVVVAAGARLARRSL